MPMYTPLGVITGLFTLTAALLSATTGIFAYILLDGSGVPTIIEIISIIFLLISLILFAAIPCKLTKPLRRETEVDLTPIRRYLASGLIFLLTAFVIYTSEAAYIKRISNPAVRIEKQAAKSTPAQTALLYLNDKRG